MEDIGHFRKLADRYEFQYPALGLVVRGAHAEWVLEAAAEIIFETEKLRCESHIDELTTLAEFGESSDVEVDSAKYDAKERFDTVPQCIVSMGSMDYKWTAEYGRKSEGDSNTAEMLRRLMDMSLTRDDSFLNNEDGVDTTGN